MKHFAHFGFDDFVLCLGYKAEVLKHFFLRSSTWNHLGAWPASGSPSSPMVQADCRSLDIWTTGLRESPNAICSVERKESGLSRLSPSTARRLVVTIALIAGLFTVADPAFADTFTASGFATETIATLPPFTPSGMAFAPDGRLFVWQKNGIVRVIKNGQL